MAIQKDEYPLGRNTSASLRLDAQHQQWVDTFGWLLHPKLEGVFKNKTDVAVADVGTGTGIFLLHLSRSALDPGKSKLVGMDISAAQYPYAAWLPENVELVVANALDPNGPPEEYRERFDIVNARYLTALVQNNDASVLVDNLTKLLKPGGYIQWGEPLCSKFEAKTQTPGSSTEALDWMISLLAGEPSSKKWLEEIPTLLECRGLDVLDIHHRTPLPWQRESYVANWSMLVSELGVGEDALAKAQKAVAESKQGGWIEMYLQCVVAQRKE